MEAASNKRTNEESLAPSAISAKKRRSNAGRPEVDDADPSDPPNNEAVMRLIAHSGCLPVEDLGRLLLLVSKSMKRTIFDSKETDAAAIEEDRNKQLWKCLCRQQWRNPATFSSLSSAAGGIVGTMGWEWIFRRLLSDGSRRNTAVPPLKYDMKEYSFVVSIYDGKRGEKKGVTPIACQIISGRNAMSLLEDGRTGWIDLDTPIKLAECSTPKSAVLEQYPESCKNAHKRVESMCTTVHALRALDRKCCPLGKHYHFDWDGNLETYPDSVRFVSSCGTIMSLGPGTIFRDCSCVTFSLRLRCTVSDCGSGKVHYDVTGVSLDLEIGREGNIEDYEDYGELNPGVTVAHLLEQLEGWE